MGSEIEVHFEPFALSEKVSYENETLQYPQWIHTQLGGLS